MQQNTHITTVRLALPVPLRRQFDYYVPPQLAQVVICVGSRMEVPFRNRNIIGIVTSINPADAIELSRQKAVVAILDTEPLLTTQLQQLLQWAAGYYHHPIGEVFSTALPIKIRQGRASTPSYPLYWHLTDSGRNTCSKILQRAPKQLQVWQALLDAGEGISQQELQRSYPNAKTTLNALEKKGLCHCEITPPATIHYQFRQPAFALHPQQQNAIDAVVPQQFGVYLLDGVTGSGKTEVYLQLIDRHLQQHKQVLLMVPEIGLTPQLLQRIRSRISTMSVLLHSGLSDAERLQSWQLIRNGDARLVIGTRSSVFAPFPDLGLIIIDEEHDASFKQQDHFRYSGRDIAIKRAQMAQIPIMLGSATPSLESLHNALRGHYTHLQLQQRSGTAQLPQISLINLNHYRPTDGLSQPLLQRMQQHLQQGRQVMLFLNRRGYAHTLLCYSCHWVARCDQCDANMTFYQQRTRLRCHHCGSERLVPAICPQCQQPKLYAIGEGTERLENALQQQFSEYEIIRIDRDTVTDDESFHRLYNRVAHGSGQILLGTQMVTKGHHFPNLTLVGVVNADQGLFSIDFRATERLMQQLLQVAGRSGRSEIRGEVLIQTRVPEHPLFADIIAGNYLRFARNELQQRRQTAFPPFVYMVVIRTDAPKAERAEQFMQQLQQQLLQQTNSGVTIYGPLPAPMTRRAGMQRWQLILQSSNRSLLQQTIAQLVESVSDKTVSGIHWSVDVDPIDLS